MLPLLAIVLLLAPTVAAQCTKPQGMVPTTAEIDRPVTLSDGYRTLANLTYPAGPPPSCGWPLVVWVHGFGGDRTDQPLLATFGYAVYSYDVRGQGDAQRLNPPTKGFTFWGPVEKYDLADHIAFARTTWPAIVSPTKLAVGGESQGGLHGWFAAAYSGLPITVPGRGTTTLPIVDAVIARAFNADALQYALPGNTLFAIDFVDKGMGLGGATIDPAFNALFQQHFLSQDPVGFSGVLNAEVGRPVASLLPASTVPILWVHAYFDHVMNPLPGVQTAEGLTTTLRAVLSTGGHGSPNNDYEFAARDELQIRWLDRWLWGVPNEVEQEAKVIYGALPLDLSVINNVTSRWPHRDDASFRASDVVPERDYLTAAGSLSPQPGTPGPPTLISHRVRRTYTPSVFLNFPAQRQLGAVLNAIPLSERRFAMATTTSERELGGRPKVDLSVIPDADRFTVCVLLEAKAPGEAALMIAHGAQGVVGATTGQAMRLAFELSPISTVLPAGTVVTAIVRNHWLLATPMSPLIVTAPYFVSCDVKVEHGATGALSWIDLPFRGSVRPAITASDAAVLLTDVHDLAFVLLGGAQRAGQPYVLAAGLSGHVPGTPLPGGVLPLELDALTTVLLGALGSPLIPGFYGLLDASGGSTASFKLTTLRPLPSALVGQRLSFAAWVFTSPSDLTGTPTNSLDLVFH